VLLIEDSVDDAVLLERSLRKSGFAPSVTRVETAGAMALALGLDHGKYPVDATPPPQWDIILADYNLPQFSAPEALDLLKSTPHDIPFIMMSGAVNEATAVAAMRAGAHDYVSKGNLARLAPAIEREIKEAASRRTKRAAEKALRLSQARFHRLVEAMPLALLIADAGGRVTYINQGLERLLGFSQVEVEDGSLTLERIFPGQAREILDRGARNSGDNADTLEMSCVTRDGNPLLVLLGAAVLNPEAPAADHQTAAFLADLSEQKRSEEVLRRTEKLAAAGKLSASIAHEINNPLEAVTNCLYLLEQTELSDVQRSYLALGQRELARVAHITTQTLRFYRQSTRAVATDIRELFETVLFLYEARMRDIGIHVERDFAELPPIVAYDGEVRQVLANFVGNALDALQSSVNAALPPPEPATARQPRIVLRSRRARDWKHERAGVAVTVADTGIGMSAATLKRIYEPFFSTKGITGTGLGLWISADIIAKHGGVLRVRTRQQAPSGTIFRLFLPFEHVELPSVTTLPTIAQR
jgi:PAS domain S-box-containing protein